MKIDDVSTSILFRIVGVTTMTQREGQDEYCATMIPIQPDD